MKILQIIITALAFLLASSAGTLAEAAGKIKVLVVTGGHGFEKEPFFKMFSDMEGISFTAADHGPTNATAYDRDDFTQYDVVVLYDLMRAITDHQKSQFSALLKKGVGLVVLHHALAAYPDWPEYEKIIGGRYTEPDPNRPGTVTDAVGWKHDEMVPVIIMVKDHPLTAGLKDFTIHDEIYWGYQVQSNVIPLITTTHPKSGKPLGWYHVVDRSRVFYLQLGHGPEAFGNPSYRRLVANGIRWTALR